MVVFLGHSKMMKTDWEMKGTLIETSSGAGQLVLRLCLATGLGTWNFERNLWTMKGKDINFS